MIPKKIHYCWFGHGPKSKLAQKCIKSWRKYCPDYEIIEWNESNIDLEKNLFAKQAYKARKWGFVPDFWRLWIIYNHGGIYLDTDVQVVKSLDDLLTLPGFAGFEDETHIALGLGFGAEKGNPIIRDLMKQYETISFIKEDGSFDQTPSPILNTEVFKNRFNVDCDTGRIQSFKEFSLLPREYLCPMDHDTGLISKTKNTYSIHRFEGTWVDGKKRSLRQNYYRHRINYYVHTPHRIIRKLISLFS